ncbi:MAG: NAD-dependent epimerase/dehydratase family protein [Actinobacteria bacterium]|nr:NAD-dependent epimerase/dehydratase family protein [Actinomycetota bacterium]MCG2818569.1 NAD-dependent epimerase/dehydratase family protein [Actinomycetes bacterium]MBU4218242.1 NAD-dependent epimerase/dehydratase family protein [Actinomycetota bacterium]MBU4358667.1 NAD-dependent epimerase/dehydratase family protein [Actinomycetota bacterium]MBU4392018.1 NAD-dependent epimerase/dehydratase family protein [Actinomycetota bacterium]
MKVDVVTGACGFSGNYVVKQLLEKGRKVRATDLESAYGDPKAVELREILDVDYERDGVEWVPSDLTRKETLEPLFEGNVGCLFHTASLYDYSALWDALEKVNIDGVTNLLDAAVEGGVDRMIHWSTCGVYGHSYFPASHLDGRPHRSTVEFLWNVVVRPWSENGEYHRPGRHPTNQPMTEDRSNPKNTDGDTPTGTYFSNEYCRSKWIQEQIVWRYHREKGLPITVVRPAPIYGPGSEYGVTGLLVELSEGLLPLYPASSKFPIFGGNVHAQDVARAAVFLSEKPESIGEDYNLADGYIITHREAIEYSTQLLGRRVRFIPGIPLLLWQKVIMAVGKMAFWLESNYPSYTRSRVLDLGQLNYLTMGIWVYNKKIRGLGFEFEYADFKKGLEDTVAWLILNGKIQ